MLVQEVRGDVSAGGGGAALAQTGAEALEELLGEEVVARLVHRREHAAERRRVLGVRERRVDRRHAAERRVRDADAGGAQLLRQRARRRQRRIVDVAAVAREALVERERRERTAICGHARPPVRDAALRVEVPVVRHDAPGDARHSQVLETGDEIVDVPRLHAVVARLERRRGERRVAEAAEVDVAVDDALGVRSRGVDEELRAEAERRRPAGQRRRRGDELLVGGREAQHVLSQLVHGALGGEVVDGHRRAGAAHAVAGERGGDPVLEPGRRDGGREEEEQEGQARQDDEQPGPACARGVHRGQR